MHKRKHADEFRYLAAHLVDSGHQRRVVALVALDERHAQTLGKLLGRVVVDHLLCRQIALVADQQLVDIFARIAVDLLQPLPHVVERNLVGDVVHHNDAVRAAIVRRCDGTEALLTGGIPDLARIRVGARGEQKRAESLFVGRAQETGCVPARSGCDRRLSSSAGESQLLNAK